MSTNTGYTNGFNLIRVTDALKGRIGWRASSQAGQPVLSADNTTANSGRYFNDFHALINIPNLKASQDNPLITDNDFNAYLQNLQKGVILRCLNGVLNVPEQLERTLLFNRSGRNDQPITSSGLFVGFEVNTPKADTVSVQVEGATFLFDGDVTFNLYLFKDGVKTPLKTKSCVVTGNEATVISFDDWILNNIGGTTKGSRFYIGYFQDDLGAVKAIREQYECWNGQKCFNARSIYARKITGQTDFERSAIPTTLDTYGLNLEVTAFRDYTNAVVKKAALFDEVIGLQMAYTVIEQIVYAVRSNATERFLKDQIDKIGLQLDLNGYTPISDSPQVAGLKQRIDRELKRVKNAFYPQPKAQTVNYADC